MYTRETAQWLIEHGFFFDTETTGLERDDRVIEIAVVDGKTGGALVDTLVFTDREIAPGAEAVHGIGCDQLVGAPSMDEVIIGQLLPLFVDRPGCAFSLAFDRRLIAQSCDERYHELFVPTTWMGDEAATPRMDVCAMELANRHLVKDHGVWDEDNARFRRLSLARCCEIAGVQFTGKAHRALADARATRDLIKKIADGEV